jgi:hypothetical protein
MGLLEAHSLSESPAWHDEYRNWRNGILENTGIQVLDIEYGMVRYDMVYRKFA